MNTILEAELTICWLNSHTDTMRQEYIDQVKTFLRDTPNFRDRLEEMRLNALISGASEDEFNQAVKELTTDTSPVTLNETVKPFMKKLVAFDAAIHILFLVFAIGSLSLIVALMTKGSFPLLQTNANDSKQTVMSQKKSETLIPQVYANAAALDGAKVFSYPGSEVTLEITGTPKREVFGYLPYWMIQEEARMDFTGLTTISFFGLEMDGGGNIVTRYDDGEPDNGWAMWNGPIIDRVIQRAKKQKIKTVITLKAFNNGNIEKLVNSDTAQKTFIANTIHMVNSKGLDGVNLDFEYIGTPPLGVRDNFTRFIQNLNAEMKRQIPHSELTLATYVNAAAYPGFFDVESLAPHIDSFVIMGYDFHTPKGEPGPVAPMEGTISLVGFMQSYLEKVTPDKIILALAHYGYDWPVDQNNKALGNAGMLSYAQIAAESSTRTLYWDEAAQTPFYTYIDSETAQSRVVHFENTRSLGIKYDYVNEKNLRGVGIWALGYDGVNNDLRSVLFEKFSN